MGTRRLLAFCWLWIVFCGFGEAFAGPNAGGRLVFHTDEFLAYTASENYVGWSGMECGDAIECPQDNESYCQSNGSFLNATGRNDTVPQVWWVLAAFPPETCPVVKEVSFGIYWSNPSEFTVIDFGSDADDQAFDGSWPISPGSGAHLRWNTAQEAQLIELCWFAGELTAASLGTKFEISPHPSLATEFRDDSGNKDPIETPFSFVGFGGQPGENNLPPGFGEVYGACCTTAGECSMETSLNCTEDYLGDWTYCNPNPCEEEGACCLGSGTCVFTTRDDCTFQSGFFKGEFVPCSPDPCSDGACCWFSGGCGITSATECDGDFLGTGTTCNPEPCDPVGACCLTGGDCQMMSFANCNIAGGSYEGDFSDCVPYPCTIEDSGACCAGDGSCTFVTAFACSQQGHAYQGDGTDCSPNPCAPPTGACCKDDGDCSVQTSVDCSNLSGTYMGNGTTCAPNPCPDPTGACCLAAGCSVITEAQCTASGGTYQGNDIACSPDPCPESDGACCLDNGTCTTQTSTECLAAEGSYLGDDTSCTPDPCPDPTGACCLDGNCSVVTAAACGGSYLGDNTSCSPDPCPDPTGACCNDDGTCYVTTSSLCSENEDAYQGNETVCTPDPCPDPTGACCRDNGSCSVITAAACAVLRGTYQGNNIACSPDPCPDATGACCAADGSCSVRTSAECSSTDGSYQGDETVCSPNPCPQPTGACCSVNGTCSVQTSAACTAAGSSYLGNGQTCSPNPCPDPTGACCAVDGSCVVRTSAECDTHSGSYQGNGTVCDPNPCPDPTGACCADDGSCTIATTEVCSGEDGSYQGHGTSCSPNPCPQPEGACCATDGSCTVKTEAACDADSSIYNGNDTTCSPNPCTQPTGACCAEDGGCELLTAAQCTAASGDYEGNGTDCDPNPCPQPDPEGACCLPDRSCFVGTATACSASSGTYQGNDTDCDPNPCPDPTGACCFPDGSCDVLTETSCDTGDGSYEGDDSTCSPNPCPQPPAEGACCQSDGTCSVLTSSDCTDASGSYEGDETSCSPNPCPQPPAEGACCDDGGSCLVQTEADCGRASGTYQGDETKCDPNPCSAPQSGPCCTSGATCSLLTRDDCGNAGGLFLGEGESCEPKACRVDEDVVVSLTGSEGDRAWSVTVNRTASTVLGFQRLGGAEDFQAISGFSRDGNLWSAPLSDEAFTPRGLECYFQLDDVLLAGSPAEPMRVQVRGVAVPGPSLSSGQWIMLSAPIDVTGRSDVYSKLEAAFGAHSDRVWRMGTFNPTSGTYTEVTPQSRGGFIPGRAYWLGTVNPAAWQVNGSSNHPADGSSDFVIQLEPGWNMIGNPSFHPITLDPSRLRVALADTLTFSQASAVGTEWVAPSILAFDAEPDGGGSYKQAPQLLSIWGGAWVKNRLSERIELLVPAEDANPESRNASASGDDFDNPPYDAGNTQLVWESFLELRADNETSTVSVGVASGRSVGNQAQEIGGALPVIYLPPPVPDQQSRIHILGNSYGHDGEELLREIRSEWNPLGATRNSAASNNSGSRPGALSWNVVAEVHTAGALRWSSPQGCGTDCQGWTLSIHDVSSDMSWDLGEAGSVALSPGIHEFRVDAWPVETPGPTSELALSLYPNPATERTAIRFVTRKSGPVQIEIMSPSGQRIWSERSFYESGSHTVFWNRERTSGEPAPAGIYFVSVDGWLDEGHPLRRTLKLTVLR